MTVAEALIRRIDEYLKQNNITLYHLVKDNNLKPSSIKNLYRGSSHTPSINLINEICKAINLDLHIFLRDDLGM